MPGVHARPQAIACIVLIISYLLVRFPAKNPASGAVLSPRVMVIEYGQRRVAARLVNQPYPPSRPQQPEAEIRKGIELPALERALRLTFRLAAQTTVETGPQVQPQTALQQTLQVTSPEALPVALQFNVQVPVELGSPIATRDPADLALRFAPQLAPRTTVRTTPGTVPGTVPGANREASFPAHCERTYLLTCCEIASYGEDSKETKILEQIRAPADI